MAFLIYFAESTKNATRLLILLLAISASALASTATTTTLAVTSGGSPVTTVTAGSLVTLSATVTAGATTIKQGQVKFCDGATHCTDIHLLGIAQITSSGTATLKLRPASGTYTYQAEFLGTPKTTIAYAASASSTATLNVTGKAATVTTIQQGGSSGDYTLTGTVYGFSKSTSLAAPSGSISFDDSTTSSILASGSPAPANTPQWLRGDFPVSDALGFVVGDFDGDGNLDVAVSSTEGAYAVNVFLGDGHGNFGATPKTSTFSSEAYRPLLVADFNGDGIPDMVLGPYTGEDVAVALGNGDGTFSIASTFAPFYGIFNVLSADVNGDGIPDLIVNGQVYLGKGDGTFTALSHDYSTTGAQLAGDFNGDGIPDLVILNTNGNVQVTIYLGKGDGTFTAGPTTVVDTSSPSFSVNMAVADFNGDGNLDLAVPTAAGIAILLGNGDGTFTPSSDSPIVANELGYPLDLGDFNGDGIPDLVVQDYPNALLLAGKGDGTFQVSEPYLAAGGVVGDFNGDGIPDVLSNGLWLTSLHSASFEATGISIGLPTPQLVSASYPGDTDYASSSSADTTLEVQAAAPAFTPPSGAVINDFQPITVTTTTPDATIYYQTSGAVLAADGYLVSGQTVPVPYAGSAGTFTIAATTEDATNYGNSPTTTATYILPSLLGTPSAGTKLTSSTQLFQWETGSQVTAYSLYLGSTPGAHDIANATGTSSGSMTLSNLPTNGETIYATMRSQINGTWYSTSSYFFAAGTGKAAIMTSPANNSVLSGTNATFTWAGGVGIDEYEVFVGTTSGAYDLDFKVLGPTITSYAVSNLPTNGEKVYVTLYSLNGGTWLHTDSAYIASGRGTAAVITSPANNSTLSGTNATFNWSGGVGIDEYEVLIGTTSGAHDIDFKVLGPTINSYSVTNLPTNGEKVYVTLYSLNGGTWLHTDSAYIATGSGTAAVITSPANNSTLSGTNATFNWSGGVGIDEYEVLVGTTPGAHDLDFKVLGAASTSYSVTNLPTNGEKIYVSLYSQNGNTWLHNNYTYVASTK